MPTIASSCDSIAMHIGSQILDANRTEGIGRLLELVGRVRDAGLSIPSHLDVGAGSASGIATRRPLTPDRLVPP